MREGSDHLPGKRETTLDMLRDVFTEESGASAVEYSLMLGFIALVILVAITQLGQTLSNMFVNFSNTITTATGS